MRISEPIVQMCTRFQVMFKCSHFGVAFEQHQGVLLDTGFLLGNSPKVRSSRKSVFRDSKNTACSVGNDEIFEYRPSNPEWEIPFRFATDSDLYRFLRKRCPELAI